MKPGTFIVILSCAAQFCFGQEIKRISKSEEAIQVKSRDYASAIASSKNQNQTETIYQNKDSLLFLKDLAAFFEAFETSLRSEEASRVFISNNRKLDYVVFVSNTGYSDAFYYDFENGKISLSFISALQTFIANHKWENPKKVKFVHRGSYVFK